MVLVIALFTDIRIASQFEAPVLWVDIPETKRRDERSSGQP